MNNFEVYLEIGKKRIFAGAVDWPGWCRSGRDEASALQTLYEYGPRFTNILRLTQFEFQPPKDASAFTVIERLEGDVSTDFGAPGKIPASDLKPVSEAELQRFQELLKADWLAFDAAVKSAAGKELRKGPRGGGRELPEIVRHVVNADGAYLTRLGLKLKVDEEHDLDEALDISRQLILQALTSTVNGEVVAQESRGKRWPPRYFVRRVAWHVLDHIWEIEDRVS